ncbi:MAG: glycoside hydrolase family 3 N-terminal domain-containing protein [Thermoanaerobaculia bacterium]
MSSRLFGVGVEGPELSAREREILTAHPPFGVILFSRNIESPEQLTALIASLRELGARYLFLDQEGGPVDRLRELLTPAPSFARAARAGAARRAGELAGEALARLGFDVDLAPVVDRSVPGAGALVLGERSASADPGPIIAAAGDFLAGLHSRGVGGCLKHFPGLGRARLDTHQKLPVIESDPHQLALDIAPFDALMSDARAIMVSHAASDDGMPASLSSTWTQTYLREILGFQGAAFSDDLEMGALSAFGELPERCARAALAGCDLLFVCRRLDVFPACVEAVERDVPVDRRAEAAERLEAYAAHLENLRAARPRPPVAVETVTAAIRDFESSLG